MRISAQNRCTFRREIGCAESEYLMAGYDTATHAQPISFRRFSDFFQLAVD